MDQPHLSYARMGRNVSGLRLSALTGTVSSPLAESLVVKTGGSSGAGATSGVYSCVAMATEVCAPSLCLTQQLLCSTHLFQNQSHKYQNYHSAFAPKGSPAVCHAERRSQQLALPHQGVGLPRGSAWLASDPPHRTSGSCDLSTRVVCVPLCVNLRPVGRGRSGQGVQYVEKAAVAASCVSWHCHGAGPRRNRGCSSTQQSPA